MSKALRVALVWSGTVLQEAKVRPGSPIVVGSGRGTIFNLPVGEDVDRYELFSASGDAFTLNTKAGMGGRVVVGGTEKVIAGAGSFPIGAKDWGIVTVGEASVYFQWVEDDAAIGALPGLAGLEWQSLNSLAASIFVHLIVLLLMYSAIPNLRRELNFEIDDRFARILADEPPSAIEDIEEEEMPDDESTSKAAGGEEGKFGAEDAEVEDSVLPDHDGPLVDELQTPELGRAMSAAIGASGALSSVFGNSDAFSNNFGQDFATAGQGDVFVLGRGVGGLGMRGGGRGGGGDGLGRVHGVGGIDTGSGRGQGASLGGRGERTRRPQVSRGTPNVNGFLSREQIERVVRRHQRGIQYCYERELLNDPALEGRISVNWTIGLDGRVESASITENSMGNRNVESCLLQEVRRMRFDQPDGGMVVVTYPFNFRSAE
jgi:TonB family protein